MKLSISNHKIYLFIYFGVHPVENGHDTELTLKNNHYKCFIEEFCVTVFETDLQHVYFEH